jgi:hypothetical protein
VKLKEVKKNETHVFYVVAVSANVGLKWLLVEKKKTLNQGIRLALLPFR